MTKRYDQNFVKNYIESFGYVMLSLYKNRNTKMKLRCPEGHVYYPPFSSFKSGCRCIECSYIKKRTSFDEVKKYIRDSKYKCMTKKENYKKATSLLELRCTSGHLIFIQFSEFKRGVRCLQCYEDKRRKSINDIQKYVKKFDYLCLSEGKGYLLSYTKLKFQCPVGHIYKSRWDHFQQGSRCPICRYIGKNSPNWKGGISYEPYCEIWSDKDFKEFIKKRDGYQCLNPYCGNNSKRIVLHHIDYNKKNCHPHNLITICNSCNGKANKDQEWHKSWYKSIIYRRYECLV